MRLCFISNPNSTHTWRWVNWFARHGHAVCLLADVHPMDDHPEVQMIDLTKINHLPVARFPVWVTWVRRFVGQWCPDILHAHRVNSAGWISAATGFHPLVVTPWGTDLYQLSNNSVWHSWFARYVLKRADLVTADSNDLLRTATRYGANLATSHLIQWGIEPEIFHPGKPDPKLLAELKLGDGPVVLSPRGVNPIYNLDTIIQSMPEVRSTFPGTTLLLRDYNTDPEYKKFLDDLISNLDLVEAVRWLGKIEPWEQQVEIYRLANVVVSVPNSDGTPVSVLEALACGIPVIASDLPSLREWLVDEQSGLFVPVKDSRALASAICRILTQKELADRFAKAGPEIVAIRANHELEMRKMEELYQQLLNQPEAGHHTYS